MSLNTFSLPVAQNKITLRQSVRNRKMRDALMETLSAAGVAESGCEKSVGDLLYTISTKVSETEKQKKGKKSENKRARRGRRKEKSHPLCFPFLPPPPQPPTHPTHHPERNK